MTRSELVAAIHEELGQKVPQTEIRTAVDTVFESITDTLTRGGRVELRGFGAFSTRKSAARIGRNPRNGEAVAVPETHYVYFRPGKIIRGRINGGEIS